jgi:hypothetical protein
MSIQEGQLEAVNRWKKGYPRKRQSKDENPRKKVEGFQSKDVNPRYKFEGFQKSLQWPKKSRVRKICAHNTVEIRMAEKRVEK